MSVRTREPDLYKKLFQSHENEQDTNTFKLSQVPINLRINSFSNDFTTFAFPIGT